MRRTFILRILFVFVATLFLASCEYDVIEPDITPIPPDKDISFSQEIVPIFTANCVECHSGSRNPDLRADNAYNSLTNGGYINTQTPASSELYEVLTGFHSNRASAQEKLLILTWIEQGAENN